MTQRYYNPFGGSELVYPVDQQDDYRRYCAGSADVDASPFPRMVDLWFAGLSIAARLRLKPVQLAGPRTVHMIDGNVFDGEDSWRVQVLMLVALNVENEVDVVDDASRMMGIANGLAAAGVPHILEMLTTGDQLPIWNLSDALLDLLGSESEADE